MAFRTLALALVLAPLTAFGLTGREVIDTAQQTHGFSRWKDRKQSAVMQSWDLGSLTRERDLDIWERTDPAGDHKTFLEFKGPADVQGTLFLHLSPRGKRDEQWLWTTQSRRVRRLAESQQDDNFFGSDLSYRDLELIVRIQQWTDAEATATLEPATDTVDGHDCHVVELVPKATEEFPYRRYRLWFATEDKLLWRVDVHDAEDVVVKRVTMKRYERVGAYTTAVEADVANVPAKTHTLFKMRDITYDSDIPDETFSLSNVSRGR